MTRRIVPAAMRLYDAADSAKLTSMLNLDSTGVLLVDRARRLRVVDGPRGGPGSAAISAASTTASTWVAGQRRPGGTASTSRSPSTTPRRRRRCSARPTRARASRPCLACTDAKKRTIEEGFAEYGARYTCALLALVPVGRDDLRPLLRRRRPGGSGRRRSHCTTACGTRPSRRRWPTAGSSTSTTASASSSGASCARSTGRGLRPHARQSRTPGIPDGIMNPGKLGFGAPRTGW